MDLAWKKKKQQQQQLLKAISSLYATVTSFKESETYHASISNQILGPFWGLFASKIPKQEFYQNDFAQFSALLLLSLHAKINKNSMNQFVVELKNRRVPCIDFS